MTTVEPTTRVDLGQARTGSWAIVKMMVVRNLRGIRRQPATFIPTLVMPIFFVITFSGAFGFAGAVFGNGNALSWYAPMAIIQGAAFAGVTIGFSAARDFETGFFDRFLLAPMSRLTLLGGALVAALLRSAFTTTAVLAVAAIGGVAIPGGLLGLMALYLSSLGVSVVAALWGLGLVYRVQSTNVGPVIQVGIFVTIFLSTAQVPIAAMSGWLASVARVNPMTNILRMARAGFVPDQIAPPAGFGVGWAEMWPGLVALAGMTVVLGAFALRGMRRLSP
ncbi:ABC transporter permease [Actinospongicola halichondriae]|uniref:ABC transporter permease n=1 Tax=Actinospongicola halichondriae TaxID=3236844 RepID=UPI003D5C3A76